MASRAARDLGLARIGTATRWLMAGAIIGGGVLSAAVAKALPGRSSHPSSSGSVATSPGTGSAATGLGTGSGASSGVSLGDGSLGGASGLSAPAQVPQPVQSAPVVNSGGS